MSRRAQKRKAVAAVDESQKYLAALETHNIKTLHDKLLIRRVDFEEQTIIIPDTMKEREKPQEAYVLAIGSEVTDVEVKDLVLIGKFVGTRVFIEYVEHIVVKHDELLAVIDENRNIFPLGHVAMMRRVEDEKLSNLVVIPDTAVKRSSRARVVAVGNKVRDVKADDTVAFKQYSESEIRVDNQTLLFVREDDILAVLESV
jgi:chaperonin GroES